MESKLKVEPKITLNRLESNPVKKFHRAGVFSWLEGVTFSSFLFLDELLGLSVLASFFGMNSLSSMCFLCNIQRS
jgi:hypothetical protein